MKSSWIFAAAGSVAGGLLGALAVALATRNSGVQITLNTAPLPISPNLEEQESPSAEEKDRERSAYQHGGSGGNIHCVICDKEYPEEYIGQKSWNRLSFTDGRVPVFACCDAHMEQYVQCGPPDKTSASPPAEEPKDGESTPQ